MEISWMWALALLVSGALVVAGCDNSTDNEGDATDDTANDLVVDTGTDPIPDPTTEPPPDTGSDTEEDGPADVPWDGEGGTVGEACSTVDDCGGIPSAAPNCLTDIMGYVSLPGGYCSADCTTSDECGVDGFCLNVVILAICVKECDTSADCREAEGYECAEPPYIGGGPYCLPIFEMPEDPIDAVTDMEVPDSDPDTAGDASGDAVVD
jgi:hypothetical protein